jgi:hypothetical protein
MQKKKKKLFCISSFDKTLNVCIVINEKTKEEKKG